MLAALLILLGGFLFAQEPAPPSFEIKGTTSSVLLPGFDLTDSSPPAKAPSEPPINFEELLVQEIKIQGLHNVKESLIRSQIKLRKGDVFDSIEARGDLKRLMALGPFASVDVTVSTMSIRGKTYLAANFILEEKPKIKKITIAGAKALSKGTIKDALAPAASKEEKTDERGIPQHRLNELRVEIDEGAFFDETKLSEGIAKISEKYEEKAVFDTTIDVEKKLDPALKKIELTFKIQEGKKARIAALHLEGFANYPPKKIRKLLKIKPKKAFDGKKIQEGLGKLNEFYKEEGWLDFEISLSSRAATPEEIKDLKFKIKPAEVPIILTYTANEGRRHFLTGYSFKGNESISSQELSELAALPAGEVLKDSKLREAQAAMMEAYRNRGFLFATILVEKNWDPDNKGVALVFDIEERQLVYIANIYIEGLLKTKEYVIKREILLKEGDLFNSKKLYKSTDKLYNLGFIEEVRPDYEPSPNPGYVNLIFDVKEGKPGMLTAGAGFSSIDGVVGQVSLQHLNLLGRAQNVNLSAEFGARRQSYDVSWRTPWTFDRRVSTTLSLFNTTRSLQYATDTTGFKRRSKGASVFFAPRFEEDTWILGAGYSLQQDEIFDVLEIYQSEIPASLTRRSAINTRATYDSRDFKWDPKRGMAHTLSLEFVGGPVGGDVHFLKPTLTHAFHLPLLTLGKHTFVLSDIVRWGALQPYHRDRLVPVSDRFYVGGAETVRGYTYTGQIGPIQGGKAFGINNLELKVPLLMEGRFTIIQFALFADVGGSWVGAKEINMNFGRAQNNLKAGIGFGLRFKTPAFPVRLDWGWGLHHAPGEAINQFYFTIGGVPEM